MIRNGDAIWIFVLLFSLSSCTRVETFEASIVGFDETSSRSVPSLQALRLAPPSNHDGPLLIEYNLCESILQRNCETATVLSRADKTGSSRIVNLESGGTALSAEHLRIGQQLIVNYALRGDLETQTLSIKNYAPPTRFLRLNMQTTLPKETEGRDLTKAIESLIIAQLSWRLPADIGIIQNTETAENIIGDLDVTYSQYRVATQWMLRSKRTEERITLTTRLVDANASTNWSGLRLSGGSHPLGHEAFKYSYESAMVGVPMFEIRPRD